MALLTINSHDYTKYILAGSWEVNRQDVYKSWTDANGINHRSIYRTRVSGEFTIQFIDRSKYSVFLNDLAAVKANGYYPMTVYQNNVGSTASINAFISMEPAMAANYTVNPEFEKFTVKLEEA